MSEIWNSEAIRKVCNKVSLMGIPPFYVTAPDKMEGVSWIIAPYRDLRVIAPLLRTFENDASPAKSGEIRRHDNDELRNILDELGVRFGQRPTDVPPHGDRVARIGERMTPSEIIALKTLELECRWAGERSSGGGQPFEARVRELHPGVERFWVSRTLEAHHIIEKSILGNLGVNTGDLKNSVHRVFLPSRSYTGGFIPPNWPASAQDSPGRCPGRKPRKSCCAFISASQEKNNARNSRPSGELKPNL